MRVRIIRNWQLSNWPAALLAAGQMFDVRSSLAIYLLALGCAELADELAIEQV